MILNKEELKIDNANLLKDLFNLPYKIAKNKNILNILFDKYNDIYNDFKIYFNDTWKPYFINRMPEYSNIIWNINLIVI